jgi:hypothetical protein
MEGVRGRGLCVHLRWGVAGGEMGGGGSGRGAFRVSNWRISRPNNKKAEKIEWA